MQFFSFAAAVALATVVEAAPSNKPAALSLSPIDSGGSVSNACSQSNELPFCCANNLVCVPGGWIQGACSNRLMCCSPTSQQQANPPGTPLSGLIGPIAGILKDFSLNIDVDAFNCLQVF